MQQYRRTGKQTQANQDGEACGRSPASGAEVSHIEIVISTRLLRRFFYGLKVDWRKEFSVL